MKQKLRACAILVPVLVVLTLVACGTQIDTIPAANVQLILVTPASNIQFALGTPGLNAATLEAALTEMQNSANAQATGTAEMVLINAYATLNSANATVGMAQTQEQNNANVSAAQIAATIENARANAQATLSSAGATQNAALTQDVIGQTQASGMATTDSQAALNQQFQDQISAATQTAVANVIATQTESALEISQISVNQASQRAEQQKQGQLTFLWMCFLPGAIALFMGLALWGFWRWLRIQQANQRILESPPIEPLQPPTAEVSYRQPEDSVPYLDRDIVDNRYEVTKPDDQVPQWLDEVKSKLRSSDKKDENDNTDNN